MRSPSARPPTRLRKKSKKRLPPRFPLLRPLFPSLPARFPRLGNAAPPLPARRPPARKRRSPARTRSSPATWQLVPGSDASSPCSAHVSPAGEAAADTGHATGAAGDRPTVPGNRASHRRGAAGEGPASVWDRGFPSRSARLAGCGAGAATRSRCCRRAAADRSFTSSPLSICHAPSWSSLHNLRTPQVVAGYAGKRVPRNDLSFTRLRVSRAKLGEV